MDTIKSILTGCQQRWRKTKQVSTVAAYEDTLTDARVTEFCRGLGRQLGENCELVKQMWLLNELRMPQLRSIAAQDASQADLIIVAVHHATRVPEELKDWIEAWPPRKRRDPTILLALLDPVYQGDSTSIASFLDQAAKKSKMQFVTHSEEAARELWEG